MLVNQEDSILNNYNITEELASRNNRLRKSIPLKFIPLMRPQLSQLEKCFAPTQSEITWLSLSIESHFEDIKKTFENIETFLSMINDMDSSRIMQNLLYVQNSELIVLADEAICPGKFLDMNVNHRKKIGEFSFE